MKPEIIINAETLERLVKRSRTNPRKRELELFRSSENGIIPAMMFNSLQLGSYVQPHKHPKDGREIVIPYRGSVRTILFDEEGKIIGHYDISREKVAFIELPGDTYHGYLALEPDFLMCEMYTGIYNPNTYKNFAKWAPSESDSEEIKN